MRQLNKLARRDVGETWLSGTSRLQTSMWHNISDKKRERVVVAVAVAVSPQHRIGTSGLSPKC